jgi:hypothetical protein
MREAVAEVVGKAPSEDLGLVFQPTKSASVDDAIAVALVHVTVGMVRLRMASSARIFRACGKALK